MKTFEQFEDDPFGEENRLKYPISKYLTLLQSIKKIKRPRLMDFHPPWIEFYGEDPAGNFEMCFIIVEYDDLITLYIMGKPNNKAWEFSEPLEECTKNELEEKMQKLFGKVYNNEKIWFKL